MPSIQRRSDGFVSRSSELRDLSRRLPAAEATALLREAATSLEEATSDRVTAVRALTPLAPPPDALLGLVEDESPRVQLAALNALGQVGDLAASDRLAGFDHPADSAVGRQLLFARALISHRLGADGPFLPEVLDEHRPFDRGADTAEIRFEELSQEESAGAFAALVSGGYGLDASGTAYALTCGSRYLLFVTRDVERGPAELFGVPRLLGLVCYVLADSPAVQFVVLSRPDGEGARLEVVRTNGEVAYLGTVRPADDGHRVTLTDLGRPGTAPTLVEGRIDDRIHLEAGTTMNRSSAGLATATATP